MKRQSIFGEKIFANVMSDEDLVPRIYKEPSKFNNYETNSPIMTCVKSLNRHVSRENRLTISKHMKRCSVEKFKNTI